MTHKLGSLNDFFSLLFLYKKRWFGQVFKSKSQEKNDHQLVVINDEILNGYKKEC